MRLILHIGTEKTGTTSLQRFFSDNRKAFLQQGVWYPRSLGEYNQIKLAIIARDADQYDNLFQSVGIESPEQHKAFSKAVEEKFAAEYQEAKNRHDRVCIISSEHLHSRLPSMAMVAKVREFLGERFDQVDVIVHLRPQVDMAISLASTACRVGIKVTRSWFEKNVIPSNPYYNYNHLVSLWEGVFGAENVEVVPYTKAPSAIDYMLAELALDHEQFRVPKIENSRLGIGTIALANVLFSQPSFKALIEHFPKGAGLSLGLEMANALQQQFLPSNTALVARRNDIALSDLALDPKKYAEPSNLHFLELDAICGQQLRALVSHYESKSVQQQSS